ncbi:hypothetical protein MTP03_26460 [Tsukamurella sp. PLM1]|nr:hypothetical protein MTP03_26460 [Tsukamurella sp. PLM1]
MPDSGNPGRDLIAVEAGSGEDEPAGAREAPRETDLSDLESEPRRGGRPHRQHRGDAGEDQRPPAAHRRPEGTERERLPKYD